MNILYLGNEWNGSDSKGLAEGFRKLGHSVYIVNENRYGVMAQRLRNKIIMRLIEPFTIQEYNDEVLRQDSHIKPDLIIVFKGNLLKNTTLIELKRRGRKCILFYPDVSLFAHTRRIPKCVPYYDYIFTTKSFMINDLKIYFNKVNTTFIPHAADTDIHKPMPFDSAMNEKFSCDVSFIATYSVKKEEYMTRLVELYPDIDLKIWGSGWEKAKRSLPQIQYYAPYGDLYVQAMVNSKINLAILSEIGKKSSSGDLITARTFQIPACGAFMLHERTTDFCELYSEGIDADCFDSVEELVEKIKFYLQNENKRDELRKSGYAKTIKYHTMINRAEFIINKLISLKLINNI